MPITPDRDDRQLPIGANMATRRKHTKLSAKDYQGLVKSEADLVVSPWALDQIHYLSSGGPRRLELSFPGSSSAPSLVVPVSSIPELASATVRDLRELHLSPARDTIISDTLDVHISVEGLIRDVHQSNEAFKKLISTLWGAQGGSSTSDRKRVTSAENGKRGGRPPKVSVMTPPPSKKTRRAAATA
jgi:hypothetical protein